MSLAVGQGALGAPDNEMGWEMMRVKSTAPAIPSLLPLLAFFSFEVPQVIVFKLFFPVWSLIYEAVAGVQSDACERGVLEHYGKK